MDRQCSCTEALDALHVENDALHAEVADLSVRLARAEFERDVERELNDRVGVRFGRTQTIRWMRPIVHSELSLARRLIDETEAFLAHPSNAGEGDR